MIAGRPAALVVAAFQGVVGAVVIVLANLVPPIVIPGVVVGAIVVAFSGVIGLIANQPPTLAAGDEYHIQTPNGQPNYVATVAPPPAATKPTVDPDPKP